MPGESSDMQSFVYPRGDAELYDPAEPIAGDGRDEDYGDLVKGLPVFLVRKLFDEVVLHFKVVKTIYRELIDGKPHGRAKGSSSATGGDRTRSHDITSVRSNLILARQCYGASGLIAMGEDMRAALFGIDAASRCAKNVIILGGTGSGKELVAEAIHKLGAEKDAVSGEFVPTNCAALSKELAASELFGHVEGAFTGAAGRKEGLLHQADGGTLFLDELHAASPDIQDKLLRAAQSGEVFRVGATVPEKVSVRFVAALPHSKGPYEPPSEDVVQRALFYRIAVLSIYLPPLCEREPRERTLLFEALMHKHAFADRSVSKVRVSWPKGVFRSLFENWSWPGNVRELENFVQALVVSAMSRRAREGRTEAGALEIDAYDILLGAPLMGPAILGGLPQEESRGGPPDRAKLAADLSSRLALDGDKEFECKQRRFLESAKRRYWSYWRDRQARDRLTAKEVASIAGVNRKTAQKHLGSRRKRKGPSTAK